MCLSRYVDQGPAVGVHFDGFGAVSVVLVRDGDLRCCSHGVGFHAWFVLFKLHVQFIQVSLHVEGSVAHWVH